MLVNRIQSGEARQATQPIIEQEINNQTKIVRQLNAIMESLEGHDLGLNDMLEIQRLMNEYSFSVEKSDSMVLRSSKYIMNVQV